MHIDSSTQLQVVHYFSSSQQTVISPKCWWMVSASPSGEQIMFP